MPYYYSRKRDLGDVAEDFIWGVVVLVFAGGAVVGLLQLLLPVIAIGIGVLITAATIFFVSVELSVRRHRAHDREAETAQAAERANAQEALFARVDAETRSRRPAWLTFDDDERERLADPPQG